MKNLLWIFVGLLLVGLTSAYYGADYGTGAYYSVIFDERGLASTVLRLDYTNSGASGVSTIDLDIPGSDVKMAGVYQKRECLCNGSDYCNCYYSYEFDPANYEKIGANTYRINLGKNLEKGETASLLVLYRAFGYTNGGLLGTSFSYETPKYGFDVDSTTVSVDVDENLYLKEGGSSGNYRRALSDFDTVSSGSCGTKNSACISNAMTSLYSYGYYSYGYTTTKSTLLAGESMTVNGSYGRNRLLLYLPEALGVLAGLGIAGFLVKRKLDARQKAKAEPVRQASLGDSAAFAFVCAVSFSALVSLIVLAGAALGVKASTDELQGPVLLLTLTWLGCAGLVYYYRSPDGRSLESSLMYVGFSVVLLPFMLLVTWFLYSIITWKPYYL